MPDDPQDHDAPEPEPSGQDDNYVPPDPGIETEWKGGQPSGETR